MSQEPSDLPVTSSGAPRQQSTPKPPIPKVYNNHLGQNLKHVKRIDSLAKWVISASGIAVIAAVIGILVLILKVAYPLFTGSDSQQTWRKNASSGILAVASGDFQETYMTISSDAKARFGPLHGQEAAKTSAHAGVTIDLKAISGVTSTSGLVAATRNGRHRYSLLFADGQSALIKVQFAPQYAQDGTRTIKPIVKKLALLPASANSMLTKAEMRSTSATDKTRVSLTRDGALIYERHYAGDSGGLFGSATTNTTRETLLAAGAGPETFSVSQSGDMVVAADTTNTVHIWRWEDETLSHESFSYPFPERVSASNFVFGDVSIVLGDTAGRLTTWHYVQPPPQTSKAWTMFRQLPSHSSEITAIQHSVRDKTLVSLNKLGVIAVDYLTSGKRLFTLSDSYELNRFDLAPRNNGLIALNSAGELVFWHLEAEHPETSLATLFTPVWYESYPEPKLVWQSTGGSDEFEPKLSLLPLIFGTLKGTLYSLVFALPLSLFGAIYLSQFAHSRVRAIAKPAIELMASLPSVVIGFLAALWLAPLVADLMLSLVLFFVIVPIISLGFIALWPQLTKIKWLRHHEKGHEYIMVIPVFALSAVLAALIAGPIDSHVFGHNLPQWIYDTFGVRYDLRNSIIIAFALGFAVIPIILSISEDSLSNVPKTIVASSLALGASRWQTVWRLVVPSASPGIFAGVMIGIGRAIGETMIVLMATGNTPIMDMSPFNGMRTLSANIAVEVAEAPVGGTLYRTLFLCAVLLFCMTFFLNTVGELVRHRLRKKYGKF